MASLSTVALQRLQRDLRECYKEPLPGIKVQEDARDIARLCLRLTPLEGPLLGNTLHLSVRIPPFYPSEPPEVTIETPISGHPNVFGTFLCCDILRPQSSRSHSPHYMGGYTPAYLLKYLFLQLLTFFSAPHIEQDYGGQRTTHGLSVKRYSSPFSCRKCGFYQQFLRPLRSKVVYGPVELSAVEEETTAGLLNLQQSVRHPLPQTEMHPAPALDGDLLHMLHDHVWLIIFDRLSDQDLVNLGKASPGGAGDVLRRYNVMLRRELVCFFTRKTFQEALLGVGVRLHEERLSYAPARPRRMLHIDAFDLLSHEAFDRHSVRRSVCGHEFTHFLPLGLDDEHFGRAGSVLLGFLRSVNLTPDLSPTGFLHVIPKLMNTMIVNMMKECETPVSDSHNEYIPNDLPKATARRAILQASEKAFKGYCLLFHLLVKLSVTFPVIKAQAQEKLMLFLSGEDARNKSNIPDLGEFVAVLPLVLDEGYDWSALCLALVEELLARNVLWLLKEEPELAELGRDRKQYYIISARRRLQDTFKVNRTGLRLMMLQANFMRALIRWRSKLDESYGFPPAAMATHLVELVKRIYKVEGGQRDPYGAWMDFFTILQYEPLPSMLETEEMLKTAILRSRRKRYHNDSIVLDRKHYYDRHKISRWR